MKPPPPTAGTGTLASSRAVGDVRKISDLCPGLATTVQNAKSRFFTLPTSKGAFKVAACADDVEILESKTNPKKVTL
jgi:hypothetical protein